MLHRRLPERVAQREGEGRTGAQQEGQVQNRLPAQAETAGAEVSVGVPGQETGLVADQGRVPHHRTAPQVGQEQPGEQGLHQEQQHRGAANRGREQGQGHAALVAYLDTTRIWEGGHGSVHTQVILSTGMAERDVIRGQGSENEGPSGDDWDLAFSRLLEGVSLDEIAVPTSSGELRGKLTFGGVRESVAEQLREKVRSERLRREMIERLQRQFEACSQAIDAGLAEFVRALLETFHGGGEARRLPDSKDGRSRSWQVLGSRSPGRADEREPVLSVQLDDARRGRPGPGPAGARVPRLHPAQPAPGGLHRRLGVPG